MNKILIIEDEAPLLKALVKKLTLEGFSVLSAKDGEKGLAFALEHHPDIILLDIIMPRMNGLTMLKRLREDDWGKEATVILLTNLSDIEKVSEAAEYGVYEYLVKADCKLEDVVKKVKERLRLA